MCHTQEITFEPDGGNSTAEWQAIDEWSEDKAVSSLATLDNTSLACRHCCDANDSKIEEVLVVHHEALQKVNFLLRHDELQACEAPTIPECVTAMRRARIQRKLQGTRSRCWGPVVEHAEPQYEAIDGDPSDDEDIAVVVEGDFESLRPFDGWVARLSGTGVLMRALRPEPLDGAADSTSEDAVMRLLPASSDLETSSLILRGSAGFVRQAPIFDVTCELCTPSLQDSKKPTGDAALEICLAFNSKTDEGNCVERFTFLHREDADEFREWMKWMKNASEHQASPVRDEGAILPSVPISGVAGRSGSRSRHRPQKNTDATLASHATREGGLADDVSAQESPLPEMPE